MVRYNKDDKVDTLKIVYLTGCHFCDRLLNLLPSYNLENKHIPVSRGGATYSEYKQIHITFPQVWIGDVFLGGCDDFQEIMENVVDNKKTIDEFLDFFGTKIRTYPINTTRLQNTTPLGIAIKAFKFKKSNI